MKTYSNGIKEVVDVSGLKTIEQIAQEFGGTGWVEVQPRDTSAEDAISKEISEKRTFLSSTDYKIIRQMETQELSESDFNALKLQRQAARDRINELEA